MSSWRGALAIAVLVAIPALAGADLPCPCPAEAAEAPSTAEALVDLILPTFIENGVSILFLGALTVVGVPWTIAGLAVLLFALPGARNKR